MNIYWTCKEVLNKLRTKRSAEPITAFFDTIFSETTPVSRRALLLPNALAFFEEHYTAADGDEVQVHLHNAVNLLGRTAA